MMLVLVASPLAVAQAQDVREDILSTPGTPITFYGHIFEQERDMPMPMNTQFPVNEDDLSTGWGGGCGSEPPLPDDSAACENWELNELFLYTTAGFVQAKSGEDFANNGQYEMLHNERGQTKDIFLDPEQQIEASLYMSADFHGWPVLLCSNVCWNWDPGTFEDWVVEAWLWHVPLGDHGSSASEAPNMDPIASRSADNLQLVAHGASEPTELISFDPTLPLDPVCGGPCKSVQEFPVPLEWDADFVAGGAVIPKEHDFVMEFEWYQLTEGQKYIRGSGPAGVVWNLNQGEDYPNRFTLPVRNPLDVEVVFPTFVHDKLVILSVINTPWGSYDIDPEATKFVVRDSDGNEIDINPETLQGGLDISVSHAGHYMPIEGQWVWDYQAQGLEPGEYTVEIEVTNFQHSFTTSTTGSFSINAQGQGTNTDTGRSGLQSHDRELEPGEEVDEPEPELEEADKESPGPNVFLALLAVTALVVGRRRS